jgi:hypothetical protein
MGLGFVKKVPRIEGGRGAKMIAWIGVEILSMIASRSGRRRNSSASLENSGLGREFRQTTSKTLISRVSAVRDVLRFNVFMDADLKGLRGLNRHLGLSAVFACRYALKIIVAGLTRVFHR